MARGWRAHHPRPLDAADGVVVLEVDEAHHIRRVLRLRAGDALQVFDGRGREWEATLTECDNRRVAARLGQELSDRVEPDLPVLLFQGMCRPERMEWVIQKATECGVAGIRLVSAELGAGVRVTGARLGRWRRVALEAAKQSGRRRVPEVTPVDSMPVPEAGALALLLDPEDGGLPLAGALAAPRPQAVWVGVGPEKGFTPDEVRDAVAAGWRRTSLGPRTLRTETAGVVAAAILLHHWGDLGS